MQIKLIHAETHTVNVIFTGNAASKKERKMHHRSLWTSLKNKLNQTGNLNIHKH